MGREQPAPSENFALVQRLHDVVGAMRDVEFESDAALENQVRSIGVAALVEYLLSGAVLDLLGRGSEYNHLFGPESLEEVLSTQGRHESVDVHHAKPPIPIGVSRRSARRMAAAS